LVNFRRAALVSFQRAATDRLAERGATEAEVTGTVELGEQFQAKFGRTGFRRNFAFDAQWRGLRYASKQVEAYAVKEGNAWLVITVIVKYFGQEGI
jgi:hypothetical protein